jgi:alkylation response protein AidB-like acyl-CoA dehydrogenase
MRVDMSFSDVDGRFQQEVRTWLATAWPEEVRNRQARSALGRLSKEDHVRWQKALAARGWAAVDWPKEHGGAGFTSTQNYIFDLERARVGAPAVMPFGMTMVAPVIMKFGTEEQKRRFLPDILNTNVWWCQGYSEPGSGRHWRSTPIGSSASSAPARKRNSRWASASCSSTCTPRA